MAGAGYDISASLSSSSSAATGAQRTGAKNIVQVSGVGIALLLVAVVALWALMRKKGGK